MPILIHKASILKKFELPSISRPQVAKVMKKLSRQLHLHSGREEAGWGWRTVDKLVSGTSMYSCEVLLFLYQVVPVLVSGTSSTFIRYFYVFFWGTSGYLLSGTSRCMVSGTSRYVYQIVLVLVSGTSWYFPLKHNVVTLVPDRDGWDEQADQQHGGRGPGEGRLGCRHKTLRWLLSLKQAIPLVSASEKFFRSLTHCQSNFKRERRQHFHRPLLDKAVGLPVRGEVHVRAYPEARVRLAPTESNLVAN